MPSSRDVVLVVDPRGAVRRLSVPLVLVLVVTGCAALTHPRTVPVSPARTFTTTLSLHDRPLELHVSAPQTAVVPGVLVVYASGDGGWFGAAVDMFKEIAGAGYPVVGFSSRAFLKIERPREALISAPQLASEYERVVAEARLALGLDEASRAVLTGWSRGAAFSVLAASERPVSPDFLGVVAIGLAEGEDLQINGAEDETDDGQASDGRRHWPFEPYTRIRQLAPLECAVIQATGDGYLPAARARALFGPDTPTRRLYSVEARNHRFSGGKRAFNAALRDALGWIVSKSPGGAP